MPSESVFQRLFKLLIKVASWQKEVNQMAGKVDIHRDVEANQLSRTSCDDRNG
jgi:hypothetical protein